MSRKLFIKYFVNPFVWKYVKKSNRIDIYNSLKKKQYRSLEKNKQEQKQKLYNIIRYAHKNVPYYKKIIENNKIKYSKETIFEDIKKFPILTKKELRENFEELKAKNFSGKYSKNTSGGSTGEPVVFLQDKNYLDWNAAGKLLFYDWSGYDSGDYFIKLWGNEDDITKGSRGLEGFLVRNMMNIEVLNAFKMGNSDMKRFVNTINKKKPKIIEAYVQSIYELAKFIERNNLNVFSPKGIITSAGVLYPDMREKIEKVFNTRVYNRYGSREVGDIACSCENSDELHINMLYCYTEILDNNFKPLNEGELGNICVTSLSNKVMPLIRYNIGDMGILSKNNYCECGRGLLKLQEVKGREVNFFKNSKGDLLDGEYFTHLIYYKENVEKFQFIQKDYNLIELKVAPKNALNKEEIKVIEKNIKKIMGNKCELDIKFQDEIEPLKSGKHMYVVSELK